ncbi:glycoside hydrolase family 13 [Gaopeijia maritima]|uniref:Glycoside hydrolase family 13 n=1 Tax=Gaopeijia maritima TaxID=3119007 RepID=A0ABU9E5Y2_9BACT
MNDDLNRWLDGDVDGRELDADTRRDAELWSRIDASLRSDVPGPAPAWIESRVMTEIAQKQARPSRSGPLAWLTRPRTVRVSPLSAGALVAAALALVALPIWRSGGAPAPDPVDAAPASVVYVQFSLEAPGAQTVAVSGDFNEWSADAVMSDPDGDGVWTLRLPMDPGVHEYMFVIDGERWVTDPLAERTTDDGFGNRNAILAVSLPDRSS